MDKYRVKNYKGNLVESLSRFQKKYPNKKIVEAVEDEKSLKITTEDVSNDGSLSYDEFLGAIDNEDVWVDNYGEEGFNSILNELKDTLKKFCAKNDFALERSDDLLQELSENVLIAMWNGSLDIFER